MDPRTWARTAVVAAAVAAFLAGPVGAQDPLELVGDWMGTLEAGGARLRLVFHVVPNEDGTLSGTMDSLDQGANGIPVTEVTMEGRAVTMSVPSIAGGFEGTLSEDGQRIDGSWSQGGAALPLAVERVREIPETSRPQEPRGPFPYAARNVTFAGSGRDVELAGTLTLPDEPGPVPAVVIVSGSGPQDRDGTVFGHRPFLVLADHLSRNGIAVLRYDDRGVGSSVGPLAAATSVDLAGDAACAVAYLRSVPEVDPTRVGIIGHSEGGIIAPMVAVEDREVAFIVLLAGPGLPGEEILYRQAELILRVNGLPARLVEANRRTQERLFRVIEEEPDDEAARERMEDIFDEFVASLSDEDRASLGVAGDATETVELQIRQLTSPWYRFYVTYDPRPTLTRVTVPVMALIGEKDLHVPPEENLRAIEAALRKGGNDEITVREIRGVNHLFQTAPTGAPAEYGAIEETFSPLALDLITEWIRARSAS